MKMRVMIFTKNGQMQTYAEAVGQAFSCLVSPIPPSYPCDKERLVLLGLSLSAKVDDAVSRFCAQLTPDKAANVALFIDGKPNSQAEKSIIETLEANGVNVVKETYYPKCGIFGKNISIEKRQDIVNWVRKVENILTDK